MNYNKTTYNSEEHKNWVDEMKKNPEMKSVWLAKVRELKKDQRDWNNMIDKLYRQRTYSEDKTLADWTIDRFKKYLEESERQLKRFQWLVKLASGKVERDELDIERAKEFPIGDIINQTPVAKSSNREFYKCPLHNETNGSFVWYKNNNSWYCFGEAVGGDSIDLYMRLHDVDFIQAVKALI